MGELFHLREWMLPEEHPEVISRYMPHSPPRSHAVASSPPVPPGRMDQSVGFGRVGLPLVQGRIRFKKRGIVREGAGIKTRRRAPAVLSPAL